MNIQRSSISPVHNSPIQPRPIAPPEAFDHISDEVHLHAHDVGSGIDDMLRLARSRMFPNMGSEADHRQLGEGLRNLQHQVGDTQRRVFDGAAGAVESGSDAQGQLLDNAFSSVGMEGVGHLLHQANHLSGQFEGGVLHALADPGKVVRDVAGGVTEGSTEVVNGVFDLTDKLGKGVASGVGTAVQTAGDNLAGVLDATGNHQLAESTREGGHDLGQGVADVTYNALHEGAQFGRGFLTSGAEIPKDLAEAATRPGDTAANLIHFLDHPVETLATHYQQEAAVNGAAYSAGHLLGDIILEPPGMGEVKLAANASREARMLGNIAKGVNQVRETTDWTNQFSDNDFDTSHRWRLI